MRLKVFTCLLCKQEYNKLDHHSCLDRDTAKGLETRGMGFGRVPRMSKAERNSKAKELRQGLVDTHRPFE